MFPEARRIQADGRFWGRDFEGGGSRLTGVRARFAGTRSSGARGRRKGPPRRPEDQCLRDLFARTMRIMMETSR